MNLTRLFVLTRLSSRVWARSAETLARLSFTMPSTRTIHYEISVANKRSEG